MQTHHNPFTIKIFMVDGSPSGLKFVEKSNWTGLGIVCPRSRFNEVKSRPEFGKAGVYVLIGRSGASELPQAYVGEGDPVRARLEDHYKKRDFWTTVYFFTSKDENLNKAHIQYLEHKLVSLAENAKRSFLENNTTPTAPTLSEADHADVEGFLQEMLLCFPVLGENIFEKPIFVSKPKQNLYLKSKGISAIGYESENGFLVQKGATAVSATVPSVHDFVVSLRNDLIKRGILKKKGKSFFELTADYEFSSPSTAADVLIGASISGRECWKTSDGTSLRELQEKTVD